jgi:ABC-type sugar transport system ATPase subunit
MNPKLLLLDDPTKGVDIHSRREIHKTLQQCAANGMTVIISSSEHEELLDIADRIYVFYEGYLSDMLAGEHKTEEHLVAAMMGMTSSPTDTTTPPDEIPDVASEKREEADAQ